ncbi:hypothetical protein BU23DRAFT_551462 [Bimuria novae-zelandiae CBS 107.79]|uniref:Uncharacterized protein n=1 Tax=Bimuria novae-zelandiae CBS 107.79 TaxID=1447943 RepID=A0A6A5VIM6_9PLEO|nr:hypothetical protein BU23DRAFT_551462 [Bimuria novae-zelandiae CBS 107.79]
MHLLTSASLLKFVLLTFVLLAAVSPAAISSEPKARSEGTDLQPAGIPGSLYACQLNDFRGDCFWNSPDKVNSCSLLLIGNPSSPFAYKPRSFGPDPGGYCDIFKGRVCNDQTRVKRIDYPGVRSPAEVPDWDIIRCFDHLNGASLQEEAAVELFVCSEDTSATGVDQPAAKAEAVPQAFPWTRLPVTLTRSFNSAGCSTTRSTTTRDNPSQRHLQPANAGSTQ